MPRPRAIATVVVAAAVLWHVLAMLAPSWVSVAAKPSRGRDFASYYYAVQAAADGEDPYARGALTAEAREHGDRRGVHPFLYPPPFLLVVAWALPLDLLTAYKVWFWLDELFAAAAVFALWRWWRPLGTAVPVVLAVLVAASSAITANHVMGQANFPGFALAVIALWQDDRGRKVLAGALMGAACMLKMSPALFVLWWLMRRDWLAAGVACLTGALLTIAALPLAGVDVQWGFYTRVLPTFGTGDYNGLSIPIDMFGNHSIPNVWHQLLPGASSRVLSDPARVASVVSALGLVGALGWLFRRPGADLLQRGAQTSAIAVALLLVPVYTYEHHCIWALPAAAIAVIALVRGRLDRWWTVPIGIALAVWCFDIADMRRAWETVDRTSPALGILVQEAKFASLLVLLAASVVVGARPVRVEAVGAAEPERATATL